MTTLGLVTVLVDDYDTALAHYTGTLGFELVEDTALSPDRRWVVVAPDRTTGAGLLLARASTPEQRSRIGDQTGGRVGFFLRTETFAADRARLAAAGVQFLEDPRHEAYGRVAVFVDRYGNRWDLVEAPRTPEAALSAAPPVQLRPMTPAEFESWQETDIRKFARAKADSTGRDYAEVLAEAQEQRERWLPEGLTSPGHWLSRICTGDGTPVGVLWLGPHPTEQQAAYIYDIEVEEAQRGRGLGSAALRAAEDLAREAGLGAIGLNVFGTNAVARRVYARAGYQLVSSQMRKVL